MVLCENLNLFATGYQLCYLLSHYDDHCFFSANFSPLFFFGSPLFSKSLLPTLVDFSLGCDFYACSDCECPFWYLFPWCPNVLGSVLKTWSTNGLPPWPCIECQIRQFEIHSELCYGHRVHGGVLLPNVPTIDPQMRWTIPAQGWNGTNPLSSGQHWIKTNRLNSGCGWPCP